MHEGAVPPTTILFWAKVSFYMHPQTSGVASYFNSNTNDFSLPGRLYIFYKIFKKKDVKLNYVYYLIMIIYAIAIITKTRPESKNRSCLLLPFFMSLNRHISLCLYGMAGERSLEVEPQG